jgi:prephenate dehydrogenase
MNQWDTVAIVGVGLMGGSLGLALRDRGLAREVIGVGRRAASLRRARHCGAVTRTTTRLDRAVVDADLVVVCTPVADVVDHVCEAARHCRPDTLLTDVGSTKEWIVRELSARLPAGPVFVGSHPLAGSEKTGPEHARPDLFEGRVTVVTPSRQTDPESVQRVESFWAALGSQVVRMTPRAHDQVLARVSHLPHLIAAALAAATSLEDLPLVAGGWKDTTRVAAGDPRLWVPILGTNRDQVLKSLAQFEKVLARFRDALQRGDETRLAQLLDVGKRIRDSVAS